MFNSNSEHQQQRVKPTYHWRSLVVTATKPQSWYRLVMKSVDQPSHVYTVNILTEVEGQVALGRPKLLETIKRRQETGIFIIWKEIKVAATADELNNCQGHRLNKKKFAK